MLANSVITARHGGRCAALAGFIGLAAVGLLAAMASCRTCPEPPHAAKAPPPVASSTRWVPVLLASDQAQVEIGSAAGGIWRARGTEGRVWRTGAEPVMVTGSEDGGLVLSGRRIASAEATFLPGDQMFVLQGRTYRGHVHLRREPDGRLSVFELVPLDDYLRGVLPAEIYPNWPMDAIVAQAVAVRTFALYRVEESGTRPWLTTLDLAYRGAGAETERTDRAVELSAGLVMRYNGRLFPAFFHSTCGGRTTSARAVFDDHDIAALRPVHCGACGEHSPHTHWQATLRLRDLAAKLFPNRALAITSLEPAGYGDDDRPEFVVINGVERMRSSEFRLAAGSMQLKSTRFTVRLDGERAVFSGRGFGHGVGLCQWGAYGMALDGHDWRAILRRYYPGAEMADAGGS